MKKRFVFFSMIICLALCLNVLCVVTHAYTIPESNPEYEEYYLGLSQYFEDIGLTPEEFLEKLNEGKVEVTDCDLNNLKGLQIGLKVNVK